MKTLIVISTIIMAAAGSRIHAQGTVVFANNSATLVMYGPTMWWPVEPVPRATSATEGAFKAALYFAPGGPSTPNDHLTAIASTLFSQFEAGIFNGGTVTVPGVPGGSAAWFQVKVWEVAYGDTYENAIAAGPQNGRLAFAGESTKFNMVTGEISPNPITAGGFTGFTIGVVPEPSVYALGVLGLAGWLMLRRRG